MNWAAIGAGIAALTFLVTVAGIIFFAGMFRQQLADVRGVTDDHADLFEKHNTRISAAEIAIVRLESWKDGYNAAARRLPPAQAEC